MLMSVPLLCVTVVSHSKGLSIPPSIEPLTGKDCEIKPLGLPINVAEHWIILIWSHSNNRSETLKRHNMSRLKVHKVPFEKNSIFLRSLLRPENQRGPREMFTQSGLRYNLHARLQPAEEEEEAIAVDKNSPGINGGVRRLTLEPKGSLLSHRPSLPPEPDHSYGSREASCLGPSVRRGPPGRGPRLKHLCCRPAGLRSFAKPSAGRWMPLHRAQFRAQCSSPLFMAVK